MAGIPQRLEQRIAEAQHQQVLHGFLAEVMIDAEGLRFGEHPAHRVVDAIGAFSRSWPIGFSSTTRDLPSLRP